MPDGYPTDDEGQIAFWMSLLKHAEKKIEPYWKVGDNLIRIYNNMASNSREKEAEDSVEGKEGISRIKAGLVFAWIDQSKADILDRNPVFTVTPTNRFSVNGAPVVQGISNHWYVETQQFHHDDRCLLDAFLMPYAVKKLGWKARLQEKDISICDLSEYVEDDPAQENLIMAGGVVLKVTPEQDHDDHIEAHTSALQDPTIPDEFKDNIIKPQISDHKWYLENAEPDINTTIQYEAPFGVRWNPKDFLLDGFAEDGQRDALWVAFRWRKRLYEVKGNRRYNNTEDLKPSAKMDENAVTDDFDRLGFDDYGICEGWEIWARNFPVSSRRRSDLLIVLATGHDKVLLHEEGWPYEYIEDFPSEILNFQTGVDTWYNKPAISLSGGDNIQSLTNEFLDSMLSTIRKQKNVFFYDKETFQEEDWDRILDLPDGSSFPVEGLKDMVGHPIIALPFQQVPAEKTQMLGLLQSLFDRAMGTPQPLVSATGETATEVNIREKRITSREDRRANLFKQFQVNTARKFWQLHQQFLPDKQFLIDPRAGLYATADEEIAKGEYRFRIDVSSRAVAEAVEAKKYLDLLNLLVGITPTLMQLGYGAPNFMEIIQRLLVRGYNIQDPESILPAIGQDPAVAQALADPNSRQLIIESLGKLKGGGDMITGQGPGPVNPQQFASQQGPPKAG